MNNIIIKLINSSLHFILFLTNKAGFDNLLQSLSHVQFRLSWKIVEPASDETIHLIMIASCEF